MHRDWTGQDALVAASAALLAWGSLRAGTVYQLPLAASAVPGIVVALGLAVWHFRGRSARSDTEGTITLSRNAALGLLLAILVVGAALRTDTLLDRPAWDDEMWTLRNIYTSSWTELLRVAFDDYWPPLYYLLLNGLVRVADTSLLWLRLPSVVFGVATLAVMYPLGMRLFQNRVPALIGVLLLTGMTSHVLYSQEARVYSFQVFLAVLSAWTFYVSYWERRVSAAFVLSTCLLTYTHSFASWYFVASEAAYVLVAWVLWRDRRAFRAAVISQAVVLALWLPLLAAFVHARFARSIVIPTHWASAPENPPWLLGFVEQYQGLAVRSWVGAAMMALLLALAIDGIIRRWRSRRIHQGAHPQSPGPARDRAVVFLLCWVLVPVLFSMAVTAGTALDTFIEIRYHLTVLPGLCLLAAAGFARIRTQAAAIAVLATMMIVPAADLPRYYRAFNRPAMDEAARIVQEEGRSDEPIYVSGGYRAFAYYYRGVFPRIGSPQWDSLATSTAHMTDEYTLQSVKWGDTYAFEKLPPNVRHFTYFNPPPHSLLTDFVRWEVARGGLTGPFWIVQNDPPFTFQDLLSEPGYECRSPRTFNVRGLTVAYCNPPPRDPTLPPSQGDPPPEV